MFIWTVKSESVLFTVFNMLWERFYEASKRLTTASQDSAGIPGKTHPMM